jgi:diguanylate cyclase
MDLDAKTEARWPAIAAGRAMDDWSALLKAVIARLRSTAGMLVTGGAPAAQRQDEDHIVPAGVLDCADALEQLHEMLGEQLAERVQVERRVQHLARHDDLTALPNRSFFRERLGRALAAGEARRQSLAVLYLDLDGFKPINDQHGHDAGDELLRVVAARLSRAVRAGDMVSRLGGDEFGCLLADAGGREQLGHRARKLLEAVSAPLQIGAVQLTVRPSIGIAVGPADGATAEALLKSADLAMYQAKRQGSGYAFFEART